MHHPQWQTRLLQVGEAKIPAQILRIDDITDPKGNRFAPSNDLTAQKQGHLSSRIFPVGVADIVAVVKIRLAFVVDKVRSGNIMRFPWIWRFVNAPEPEES